MNTYTIHDIIKLGYNLTPLKCLFCESNEVIFNQSIGDACCESCGLWQLD